MFISPNQNYVPLKSRPLDDRPREKMKDKGKQALSNAEILGILIGSGTKEKSAVELSREILGSVDNSWDHLGRLTLPQLTKFKGIGEAKAISIMAALELGRRRQATAAKAAIQITDPIDVYHLMRDKFLNLPHEEFHIVLLNQAKRLIRTERISVGGWNSTSVDGKVIFRSALLHQACSVVLTHNHPSGTLKPSRQDLAITKKLKLFGEMIGLTIIDHLIFTDRNYYSFDKNGIM